LNQDGKEKRLWSKGHTSRITNVLPAPNEKPPQIPCKEDQEEYWEEPNHAENPIVEAARRWLKVKSR
jgi:hypothetical protein